MIPYSKQNISESDIDAVVEVLRSDFLTQGDKVPEFEEKVADYCNSKFAIAANSATSCLHLACMALQLKKGDILWTSPNSFVASANCGLYCGSKVDFVDIDKKTHNMCPIKLEEKLKLAKKRGNLPKIVIPVHFAGQSCDMKAISKLSKKYGFRIIEDASHAIGGEYLNKKIGNCEFSDMAVFSFHPVKILTTGEGGMVTTNNENLYSKLNLLRTHGISKDLQRKGDLSTWLYEQQELGYNYRLSDIHAALGISQLTRIDSSIKRRHDILNFYEKNLDISNITLPFQSIDSYSSLHLYPIELEVEKINRSKEHIFDQLRKKRLGVNVHYIPIHFHPYFKKLGFKEGDFPNAEDYYNRTISIPMFPDLKEKELIAISKIIKEVVHDNC
tara:strand:+ start:3422 stop:4582 length:1161 start_codon:yes stop_codon:yes gene_type:complete